MSLYAGLEYALSLYAPGMNDEDLGALEELSSVEELDEWEAKLYEFAVGKLDEKTLLNQAQTKCEKTEANFYVGFMKYVEGKDELAKDYFQKVLDYQLYSFSEYQSAREYMKHLR